MQAPGELSEPNDNNSANSFTVEPFITTGEDHYDVEFRPCKNLFQELSEESSGLLGSGLNDTLSLSSVDNSFEKLSVSDISAHSTDSLVILTPRSSEVISRSDLPLFERQSQFQAVTNVRPSLSELSVKSSGVELENKFSSTSVDTVIPGKRSNSQINQELELKDTEENSSASYFKFGLIDIVVRGSVSKVMPHFLKYIPIDEEKSSLVPTCLHNQVHPSEWWNLQSALTRQSFGIPVLATSSETAVEEKKKKSKKKKKTKNKRKRIKHLFMCTAAQDSPLKPGSDVRGTPLRQPAAETCYLEAVDTADSLEQNESNLPALISSRFDQANNENYIKVSCNKDANFTATLYTPIPEDPNFDLCHFQTDMAVTAMLAFFHPWSEMQCVWVKSLRSKLAELLHEGLALRPKFARSVRMCEFKAILVVSEDAGCLIRHRSLSFLHSIASALCIEAKHLLVLVREGSTCLDTTVNV